MRVGERLFQDLLFSARVLRRNPGFAIAAIITLAAGIGANTAVFSVVNAVLLTPIAIPEPDRVVRVWTDKVNRDAVGFPASVPDFVDWRSTGVFEQLAAFSSDPVPPYTRSGFNVRINNRAERLSGEAVTAEWFEILRIQPQLGRVFRQEDMRPGHTHVMVLAYGFWNARFNADPRIIGKSIFIDGAPYTIIGVLPKRVPKLQSEAFYIPFALNLSEKRGFRFLDVVGRLAPGVSLAAAQRTLNWLNDSLRKQYPAEDGPYQPRLQLINEAYVQDTHALIIILFSAVVFVLLIACTNIASLMLVRGTARHREIAIRVALGAGRITLLGQLLTESVLLALLGALAGLVPAWLSIRVLAKFRPETLPNADLIDLNSTVLLFTLILAFCTGILFGMIPAWDAWRHNVASPMRERAPVSSGRLRVGNLFIAGEVAISVVLVAAAILMLRSFIKIRSAYPGYDTRVLTMRISLTGTGYDAPEKEIYFYKELLRRLTSLPGLRSVGAIDCLPTCSDVYGGAMHFTDRPEPPESEPALVIIGSVTPDYLRTMKIPLIRGRYFSKRDDEHAPETAILDEETARRYWPKVDPIGRSVRFRMNTPLRRIVGVVGNIDHPISGAPNSEIGQVYVPAAQLPHSEMSVVVSSPIPIATVMPALRRQIAAFAPDVAPFQIQTMADARAAAQRTSEFGTWLLNCFAMLSLVLAAVGVYGVTAYTVQQRTREIGTRMAVGGTFSQVLRGVFRKASIPVIAGLALGFIGAIILTSQMRDLLNGMSSTDPMSLLATMSLLAIAGCAATFIPAYRACRMQPVTALRYE